MIQKQSKTCISSSNKSPSIHTSTILTSTLRIKYHEHLINYRHQLKFQKYYGSYSQHEPDNNQKWAYDILTYSNNKEYIIKKYNLHEVMSIIRKVIILRVQQDLIAPRLVNFPVYYNQENKRIYRILYDQQKRKQQFRYRYGYGRESRESNTMHTQSCIKYDINNKYSNSNNNGKFQEFGIQKLREQGGFGQISTRQSCIKSQNYQNYQKQKDYSNQMLYRINQDLSKMIQCHYNSQQKSTQIGINRKNSQFQYTYEEKQKNKNVKSIKHKYSQQNKQQQDNYQRQQQRSSNKIFQANISIIKSPNKNYHYQRNVDERVGGNNNRNYLNYDDPQQNYGLKKFKKSSSKQLKHIKSQQFLSKGIKNFKPQTNQYKNSKNSKSNSKTNVKKTSLSKQKQKSTQKLCRSPLTPRPIPFSRQKQGWGQIANINKCSRLSMKSRIASKDKFQQQKNKRNYNFHAGVNMNVNIHQNEKERSPIVGNYISNDKIIKEGLASKKSRGKYTKN